MKIRRLTLALSLSAATGLALTATAGAAPGAAPAPPEKLTIGIKYDQPGLGIMGPDGRPQGFDVDVATYVARELGVQPRDITWKEARSSERERMINNGEVDLVVASYSITTERKRHVTFAGPYLVTGQDLLVRKDNKDIKGPDSLNGKTVCTAAGSTSALKIKQDFAAGVRLTTQPTYSACVKALLARQADAVTTDDVILAGYAAEHPDKLRVVGNTFTRERYGIGLGKGDAELQQAVTTAIEKMIDDGSWKKSLKQHIGPSGYRLPEPPPVFNASDTPTAVGGPAEPALAAAVDQLIDYANAKDWKAADRLICEEAKASVEKLVTRFTPEYDPHLGADGKKIGFHNTVVGVSQTSPTTGNFLVHETFTNVPAKHQRYVKDVIYTGEMVKKDGRWKMCHLAADFQED